MKFCSGCKTMRPTNIFSKKKSDKSGLQTHCNPCCRTYKAKWRKENQDKYRSSYLLKKFGINYGQYLVMLEKQDHRCAICKEHKDNFSRVFAVDHSHKTKNIRGLLCNNCNRGIGHLKDSEHFLTTAILYLKGDLQCQQ